MQELKTCDDNMAYPSTSNGYVIKIERFYDERRKNWKLGDAVDIFSTSKKEWFEGEITKIFGDDEGEWLVVTYGNPARKTEIGRYSESIRPVTDKF